MTVSFLTQFAPEPLASVQHASTTESVSPPEAQPDVEESRHILTDAEREAAIALAASLIEHHMDLYEISGCFSDRGNADRARLSMEALIKGRSAEQIARMERELGLA